MTKHLLSAGLLGTLSVTGIFAQNPQIKFEEYDLPNGLHVILHEDHTVPLVAVTVNYHVGSKNENPERTGFAHFFEHLMFEGSPNIKRGEFMKYISNAGGDNNAYTTQDQTFYHELLPSNQLELGLWLESERMLHSLVEDIGVNTQREVVKEEKRLRVDNQPYGRFISEIFVRAFKKHPYRWAPIGSMEHLNAAALSEFIDFYKTFYVPNNAVLTLTGDIDVAKTKTLVDKYFKDIPKGTKEIPRPKPEMEPALGAEVRDSVYDEFIQLPAVIYAYRIPSVTSPDYYALQMMSQVLSGGASSRMNKELVDKQQKALQAFAFSYALEDAGLFITASIVSGSSNVKEMDGLMQKEVDKMKADLISDSEFDKMRNQIESQEVSANEGVMGVATNLSNGYMFQKNTNYLNTELENYMKVTKDDIKRVANKYLVKENRVVLFYLPKKK
jgi:zinc protease